MGDLKTVWPDESWYGKVGMIFSSYGIAMLLIGWNVWSGEITVQQTPGTDNLLPSLTETCTSAHGQAHCVEQRDFLKCLLGFFNMIESKERGSITILKSLYDF